MKKGSILIISNKNEIGENIQEKLKLLRECDTSTIVSQKDALSILNSTQPSIIIVYSSDADTMGIIKEMRGIKALNKVPVIFVMDTFDQESLKKENISIEESIKEFDKYIIYSIIIIYISVSTFCNFIINLEIRKII